MTVKRIAIVVAVLLGVLAAVALGRSAEPVPSAGATVGSAVETILPAGFKLTLGPEAQLLAPVEVTSQFPPSGWWWLKGLAVTLQTRQPSREVTVPVLVGRLAGDAQDELYRAGLDALDAFPPGVGATGYRQSVGISVEGMPDGEGVVDDSVVVTQTPPPGTMASFGDPVEFESVQAHAPGPGTTSTTAEAVRRVHGVFFLRYGLGDGPCGSSCHGPDTCVKSGCHEGAAWEGLGR